MESKYKPFAYRHEDYTILREDAAHLDAMVRQYVSDNLVELTPDQKAQLDAEMQTPGRRTLSFGLPSQEDSETLLSDIRYIELRDNEEGKAAVYERGTNYYDLGRQGLCVKYFINTIPGEIRQARFCVCDKLGNEQFTGPEYNFSRVPGEDRSELQGVTEGDFESVFDKRFCVELKAAVARAREQMIAEEKTDSELNARGRALRSGILRCHEFINNAPTGAEVFRDNIIWSIGDETGLRLYRAKSSSGDGDSLFVENVGDNMMATGMLDEKFSVCDLDSILSVLERHCAYLKETYKIFGQLENTGFTSFDGVWFEMSDGQLERCNTHDCRDMWCSGESPFHGKAIGVAGRDRLLREAKRLSMRLVNEFSDASGRSEFLSHEASEVNVCGCHLDDECCPIIEYTDDAHTRVHLDDIRDYHELSQMTTVLSCELEDRCYQSLSESMMQRSVEKSVRKNRVFEIRALGDKIMSFSHRSKKNTGKTTKL